MLIDPRFKDRYLNDEQKATAPENLIAVCKNLNFEEFSHAINSGRQSEELLEENEVFESRHTTDTGILFSTNYILLVTGGC